MVYRLLRFAGPAADTKPAEEYLGIGNMGEFPEWRAVQTDDVDRFVGRGPRSYRRTDDKIIDDICERLTRDPRVDATFVEIKTNQGEVTITGVVGSWEEKQWAGEIAADVFGVQCVQNELRIEDIV
jgi:osmotically-inducible protein OsmY